MDNLYMAKIGIGQEYMWGTKNIFFSCTYQRFNKDLEGDSVKKNYYRYNK